jgi:hypothetical protein
LNITNHGFITSHIFPTIQTTYPTPTHHIIQTKTGAKFSIALDVPVRPECMEIKRINTEINPRHLEIALQKKAIAEYR